MFVPGKRRGGVRYFFVALSLFSVVLALVVFLPVYYAFVAGKLPIAAVIHVHALLMSLWLAAFLTQAVLASTGRIGLHRMVGAFGIALGVAVWASMVFVEMRSIVVQPVPSKASDYDWLLPGVYCYTTFLLFFAGAVCLRRTPAWHKRLMLFATFVAVQAVETRMAWLPHASIGYWSDFAYVDACLLLPLIAYDFATTKRVHAATLTATAIMLSAQVAVVLTWGTPGWHRTASAAVLAIRAAF